VALPRLRIAACTLTIQLLLGGCELIADFDSGDTEPRTVQPTPIPMSDGSMPIVVDGSVRDAAVVIGNDGGATSALRLGMDAGVAWSGPLGGT
jgi:hypothetical protein